MLSLDDDLNCLQVLLELLAHHREVEMVSRCLLFLLEIHHGPILANRVRFHQQNESKFKEINFENI